MGKNYLSLEQAGILDEVISNMSDEEKKALISGLADIYVDGMYSGVKWTIVGYLIGGLVTIGSVFAAEFIKLKIEEHKLKKKGLGIVDGEIVRLK